MKPKASRRFIIEALEQSGVSSIRRHAGRAAFLDGTGDIQFDTLEMDSLARMELCIYIEVNTGVELTPDQLDAFISLENLADKLVRR